MSPTACLRAFRILSWLTVVLPLAAATPARAALANPAHEDLDFIAEHLMESAMDLRFATYPVTSGVLEDGRWRTAVGVGWGGTRAGDVEIGGLMVSGAAAFGLSDHHGLELSAFYDRFPISGSASTEVLRPLWKDAIPLDLPEFVAVSEPGGDVDHSGIGAAWLWRPAAAAESCGWAWRFGAVYSRLEARDYAADYRVLSGASEGTEGVVDYSASYDFISPMVEGEFAWTGQRWRVAPHASFFMPLPRRGFVGRLTGPGFDLTGDTASVGNGTHMGDSYLALGCRFEHRPSGLSADLGATLFAALAEGVVHKGVSRAIVFQLSWHWPHG